MQPFDDISELREEQTAAYDQNVDAHQDLPQGKVTVLVDAGCNDVRTARAAVVQEDDGQTGTGQAAADDQRHEVLSLAEHLDEMSLCIDRHELLRKLQHEIKGEDGVDGLHHELESQYLQCDHQQGDVDDHVGVFNLEACGIVDDGRHTCHAACHNLIGEEEDGKGRSVDQQAYGQEEVVFGLGTDELLINSHRSFLYGKGRRISMMAVLSPVTPIQPPVVATNGYLQTMLMIFFGTTMTFTMVLPSM